MKQLPRDEYGYINNRGRSPYWGVTVNSDPNGKDRWVVSYKPTSGTATNGLVTHSLYAESFTLSEKDAALIGAAIYETGQTRQATMQLKVQSADKKWVFAVRNGTVIYRERFNGQKVHVMAPTLTLLDVDPATNNVVAKSAAPAKVKSQVVEPATMQGGIGLVQTRTIKRAARKSSDTAFAAKLANMILSGNLSERSTKALIGVLESTLKTGNKK